MKICTNCDQELSEDNFNKRKKSADGLASRCKQCHATYNRGWYAKVRETRLPQILDRRRKLLERNSELKSSMGCKVCGERAAPCLEWHHLDPTIKEGEPTILATSSWNKFLEEIKKCVVLCSNCHKKLHAGLISID